jgi:CRISPR-associated protein Cas2
MSHRTALFAYDIHNDRLRRLSLRSLREWRLDGQLSVHECVLTFPEATALFTQLNQDLDPQTDHLLFAWVQSQRPILARGRGRAGTTQSGLLAV